MDPWLRRPNGLLPACLLLSLSKISPEGQQVRPGYRTCGYLAGSLGTQASPVLTPEYTHSCSRIPCSPVPCWAGQDRVQIQNTAQAAASLCVYSMMPVPLCRCKSR